MFGIGGGEIFFILIVILMLFGSDKIPEIARTLGKGMAQLKNATNEIKHEIQKGAEDNGLDMKSLTGGISDEIASAKESMSKSINPIDLANPINEIKEDIENLSGPIKRQM
ncbi:Sec-independent protein translocase TatA [Flavobacterium sp. F372]|uniref:Twin-arginine translocase TatA/TatE family subunit n=1 Tax=Flavobacterium bernardetii TaxID=2813823 RepID=A0ABR7J098_9FLAO|nr:twin-arginine translocase TatA/TatE family subunit [Flavobacterium bernardetii]MBC5835332.1 twin-arginine translocase TatA/TatE family subunit [Flavobacterium bernardetii]NHF69677.1 Sec-independent protein translocase TatA [Flavobacterium bernardetii]